MTKNQDTNGFWYTADHPGTTALALHAFMGEPTGRYKTNWPTSVKKGYAFLIANVQPDGGIYRKELQNYNTSLSLLALVSSGMPEYASTIRRARQWLVGQQIDLGEKGKIDSPFDGGIGYGSKGDHSDMNNTLTALEALYYSKDFDTDKNLAGSKDLNWKAVLNFLQSCQNLPGDKAALQSNSRSAKDGAGARIPTSGDGGFFYEPGESKAGFETNAVGKVALRSYGSISYGGLLSYIYADLKRDDPRVTAVTDWLAKNFSLEENPGLGAQGYFYYLNLMTKALSASGVDQVELRDGKTINWRKDVAMKLINLQKRDGSWANENGRWWEKDPALVTSYALLSLEMIYQGL
ncbi:MAG: cycloartenol synthase [Verrucomicrobiota bacterium]